MSFMLYLTEPHFMLVFATALLAAAVAGALGVFLVLRGMALFGDGVAHISFAGIALGFVFGVFPLGVALVTSILGALLIETLYRSGWVRSDSAIGIVFTASLAFGIVLISSGAGPGFTADVETYLFGNLVLASSNDFWLVLAVGACVALVIGLFFRPLLVWAFDEEAAKVQGLPVGLLSTLFTVLTAATIVATVRVVGVLLVSSLLIIPASASLLLTGGFRSALLRSVGIAMVAVVAGLLVSATWDLAPGGTIALCAAAAFFLLLSVVVVRKRSAF